MTNAIKGSRIPGVSAEQTPRDSNRASLFALRSPLPFYLGVLLAFLLPFMSISCDGTETGSLSGVQLLRGGDITGAGGPRDTYDYAGHNVDRAAAYFSARARVAFVLTFLSAMMAVVAHSRQSKGMAGALIGIGALTALMYVPLFAGAIDFSDAPDVHHEIGLYLAVGLAIIALIADVRALKSMARARGEKGPFSRRWIFIGTVTVLAMAVLIFAVETSSFSHNSWERPDIGAAPGQLASNGKF